MVRLGRRLEAWIGARGKGPDPELPILPAATETSVEATDLVEEPAPQREICVSEVSKCPGVSRARFLQVVVRPPVHVEMGNHRAVIDRRAGTENDPPRVSVGMCASVRGGKP